MAIQREAVIRVKLDLTQAKADLQGLVTQAHATGVGIGAGVSGRGGGGGGGGGGFNLGAMMGAGFVGGIAARAAGAISDPILGAIAGPSIQAAGQVGGELAGTLGQSISKFAFGDSPAEARAGSQAREETIAAYGYSEGRRGGRPSDAAKAYFDSRMRQLEPAEKGRTAIEGDKRFRGASLESIANNGGVAAVVAGVGNELMKAADRIVEGMRGFFNGGR